jgi:hypothetical protein
MAALVGVVDRGARFLQGLVDSSSDVRDLCKEIYPIFKKKYPSQALV